MTRRNPATETTARGLLRAVRGMKAAAKRVRRAKRAVNRPAKKKRPPLDRREALIAKLVAEGFERKDVARFVTKNGVVGGVGLDHDLRRAMENIAAGRPIDAAPGWVSGGAGTWGESYRESSGRSMTQAEFSDRIHGRTYADNPPRQVRARGRALALQVNGKELVGAIGRGAEDLKRGLALYRKWSGHDAGSVQVASVPPGTPPVLVLLGELTDVGYRSDKWTGRHRYYIHKTQRPRPLLCATPDGRRVVVLGGNLNVRAEGLTG